MTFVLERSIHQLRGKKSKEKRNLRKAACKANVRLQIWSGVAGGIAGGFILACLVMSEVLFDVAPYSSSFVRVFCTAICLSVVILFLFAGFVINPLLRDTLERMSTEQTASANAGSRPRG